MGTPVASGWCTTSYEAKDQYEAWRQKLDAVYGSWTLSNPTKLGIEAKILQHSVGNLQLVNCICDPCGAVRKRADSRDGQDMLAVQLVLSGRETLYDRQQECRSWSRRYTSLEHNSPNELRDH